MNLRNIVFTNLDHALVNGYFERGEYLDNATAEEVADDMVAMASDCENYTAEQILPHVKEWLEKRPQR
jgi:hypothetical protein